MPVQSQRFQRIFDHVQPAVVEIIGSALRSEETAHDIDVLFLHEREFKEACQRHGVKYNGWNTAEGHVRRANVRVPGVDKPVQYLHYSFSSPYAALARDGSTRNAGHFFIKPSSTAR